MSKHGRSQSTERRRRSRPNAASESRERWFARVPIDLRGVQRQPVVLVLPGDLRNPVGNAQAGAVDHHEDEHDPHQAADDAHVGGQWTSASARTIQATDQPSQAWSARSGQRLDRWADGVRSHGQSCHFEIGDVVLIIERPVHRDDRTPAHSLIGRHAGAGKPTRVSLKLLGGGRRRGHGRAPSPSRRRRTRSATPTLRGDRHGSPGAAHRDRRQCRQAEDHRRRSWSSRRLCRHQARHAHPGHQQPSRVSSRPAETRVHDTIMDLAPGGCIGENPCRACAGRIATALIASRDVHERRHRTTNAGPRLFMVSWRRLLRRNR